MEYIHAAPMEHGKIPTRSDLFEGDLKLSKEFIMKHYNFSSVPGGEELLRMYMENASKTENDTAKDREHGRTERAAANPDYIRLWSNAIVPYEISSRISKETQILIRQAMDHWEDNTCLRFVIAKNVTDYVEFVNTDSGCYSNTVGNRPDIGKFVNLETNNGIFSREGCEYFSVITHEIGHVVGFWHEQSRLDRDSYITINWDNIEPGGEPQFMQQSSNQINSTGSVYDYGSIMHYGEDFFSKSGCSGDSCITMSVNNAAEYRRQGRPVIGEAQHLSAEDITQTNRLYSCPISGVHGFLFYRVKRGTTLEDTDPVNNDPDPYVKLISVDSEGNKHTRRTSIISDTVNPVWNEWIFLTEREWQYFRISVWDDDNFLTFRDDEISISQTIAAEAGQHPDLKHCENTRCRGFVTFDYNIISVPHTGRLQVNIRSAHRLPHTDPMAISTSPDPYVRIEAVKPTGKAQKKKSKTVHNQDSPTWDQIIEYSCRRWAVFQIQVWDEDSRIEGDDKLSNKELIFIQPGLHTDLTHNTHRGGYLTYDYNFIVDGDECNPNPCLNGGICTDGCSSFTCSCTAGYTGPTCADTIGNLQVTARYGRNLPNEDGWFSNSDPYIEFIAIDANGNSHRKTTRAVSSNLYPEWNQSLNFGENGWRELKVRVYDHDDLTSDDPLSDQQTFPLPLLFNAGGVRHRCYRGYVVFDFSYS